MRARPTYTEEFRNGAVNLLKESDRSFKDVAESLGVSVWSLRGWYRLAEMAKKPKRGRPRKLPTLPAEETAEQKLARLERENASLRRENDSLRMDREILKKAAAFFAKENE